MKDLLLTSDLERAILNFLHHLVDILSRVDLVGPDEQRFVVAKHPVLDAQLYDEGKVAERQILKLFRPASLDELSTSVPAARNGANIRVDADFGALNLLLVHRSGERVLNGGAPFHFVGLAGAGLLVILEVKVVVLALVVVEKELDGVSKDLVVDLWNLANKVIALPFRHVFQVERSDLVALDVVAAVSRTGGRPIFNFLDLKLKKVSLLGRLEIALMESVLLFLVMNLFRLERFAVVHLVALLIVLIGNNAHNFVPDFWLHSVCESFLQPTLDGFLRWGHFVETEALEGPSQRLE